MKHSTLQYSNKRIGTEMCSEDSKDLNTTNNCPEWDCKQADKNKHDNNYNWLYRLSRTSS